MNRTGTLHKITHYLIAAVWLVNGLLCKVLHLVPRHQQIVARILGAEHATFLTRAIGLAEVCLALWILSGQKPRWCALIQIVLVMTMNMIELIRAPDLLLFGSMNALFALVFVAAVYWHAFIHPEKAAARSTLWSPS